MDAFSKLHYSMIYFSYRKATSISVLKGQNAFLSPFVDSSQKHERLEADTNRMTEYEFYIYAINPSLIIVL